MDIGAQVSTAGGLVRAVERGVEMGAPVIQIFALSPRRWTPIPPTAEQVAAFVEKAGESALTTFCHASYLINLASSDAPLYERSIATLSANLQLATKLGSAGVVLHLGSHRGAGFDQVVGSATKGLLQALETAEQSLGGASCPLLLENAAGAGGTLGRDFEELDAVIDAAGGDPRLRLCLDTQHLFASGIAFSNEAEAEALLDRLETTVGLGRLGLVHLNDSKVDFGANCDRHENLGEGKIGKVALGALLSAPRLGDVPAVLEVPGKGEGPRQSDLVVARSILRQGINRRRKADGRLTGPR